MVSLTRIRGKKELDASDFRSIVNANYAAIDQGILHGLADEVFAGGGDEILQFLQLAINDEAFPL